jgi:hypothetical protein
MKDYLYEGKYYTEYVPIIEELYRNGKYSDAISLLEKLIDLIEIESKEKEWGVAPWYYEKLANIYKKMKDKNNEILILKRFSKQKHANGVKPERLKERLIKLIS